MTEEEQFAEWVAEVNCDLFHVMPTDLDDEYGVRIDQLSVLHMIDQHPWVLKHKTLRELLELFEVLD